MHLPIAAVLVVVFAAGGCLRPLPLQEFRKRQATAEQLLSAAVAALRRGDAASLGEAETALRLAEEIAPEDPRVSDGLGCVEYRRGNLAQAESFFERAIFYDVFHDRAHAHLALIAERRGDSGRARRLFRRALKLNPLNYRARNNYALLLADQGQYQAALAELGKARQASGGREPIIERNLALLQSAGVNNRRRSGTGLRLPSP